MGPGTSSANRDLILGVTRPGSVRFPGMVAMSKILPPASAPTFTQGDLAGPWRVYLQRVESKLAGSTTQIGQLTFTSAGAFSAGTLQDAGLAATALSSGSLLVSANGSVTGSLNAGALASTTADRYTFTGSMRAGKDLITGVITARLNGRTTFHHGLVTMVREVTLLDFSLAAYSVAEGSPAAITVNRTGNREGTVTVNYAATAGTAPAGDFTAVAGTLTFGPGTPSQPIAMPTTPNNVVDGSRTVNLTLSAPVIVSAPAGVSLMLGGNSSAVVTISDNDVAGSVKLSAATYAVTEATPNATIVVQRTGGAAAGVVVQLATADGTAEAGRDYTARNTSLTFNAGETSKTLLVPITNTTIADGPRSFTVAITGATPPSTVVGSPSTATVNISDNDVAGTLQFSLAGYSITEPTTATATAMITVTRTGGMAGGVLVDFVASDGTATGGADYGATSGTLSFGAGNVSRTFFVPVFVDALVEGDETVLLSLSNPQGGASLGAQRTTVLTIKDGQRGLQFSASSYAVNESQGTATITVVRTGPATGTATVRYSTSDGTAVGGTHYTPASGVLTFGNNVLSQSFTVKVLPDKTVSGARTVLLVLSNPTPGDTALAPRSSAVLTINNVDVAGTVKLGAATYSVSEALAAATITVTRTGGTAGGVTVSYTTLDDCATPPCPGKAQSSVDYELTAGTLTFGPGETTKTVLVPITNDTIVEGNETFLFTIGNPTGGAVLGTPVTATATIVDNDSGGVIQLSTGTYTVTEPNAVSTTANIVLTRTGANLAGGATVQFATSNGTATSGMFPLGDYTATVTTVVFGAGETARTVQVPIHTDADVEGNETVNITLANPGGGATLGARTSAVLTIVDSSSSVQFSASDYTVNEGGTVTVTVVRGGSLNGQARIQYATQDGPGNPVTAAVAGTDYRNTTGVLTFNTNVGSLTFTVPTIKRAADNGTRSLTVSLAVLSGLVTPGPRQPATITIQDLDPPGTFQFGAAGYSVVEGGMSPVFITRSGGSGGTVVVEWSVLPGGNATAVQDYTVPALATARRLTFGPGVTTPLRVPITIVNDTLAETPETVVLGVTIISSTVGTPGMPGGPQVGVESSTTLAITDNDHGGAIRFASSAVTVPENVTGGRINLTVSRTAPAPAPAAALASGVTVGWTASGDTGAVTQASGTLTFGAGQTTQVLQVPIAVNTIPEADRVVAITLSNPLSTGGATGANAPTLGAVVTATATITDDEPRVQFSAVNYNVTEGGAATVTAMRSGSSTGTVTVNYATADGTAVAPTDYTTTGGTLTFPAGMMSRTFTVATVDDPAATGPKVINLALTPGSGASIGARSAATVTIQDGDSAGAVQFASAVASVVEGGVVRVFVTRAGSNLTGGVTVGWSATGGTATPTTEYTPTSGTLSFGPGVTTQSFDITTVGGDGEAEGTETIVLSLDPPTGNATLGSPSAMTLFMVDADQSLAFGSSASTVGETTAQAAVTVVRLGVPSGTVTVNAMTVTGTAIPDVPEAQPGLDYTAVGPVTLTFGPGEIVKTVNVPILTANALARAGNRALGLTLTDPSVNAALGPQAGATLTILDFRPDLVITTVSTPGTSLTGKLVSAPTTVRNLGMVASPAFRVGLFFSLSDTTPGAGALLALRDVPALAPGASMSLPTQITIDDDTPPGDYFVSAVADFTGLVGEADESNNGRASAPSFLRVSRNLTKFQSASASLSQTSPPPPPGGLGAGPGNFAASSHGCDAQGAINLSGSFTITNQQEGAASGVADLTGTLNDIPVRYVITFDGTADDNDNVTATLTSISATGAFIGSGTGTFVGTLDGRTLSGAISGQIVTSTGGNCLFTGTLTAVGSTSFLFKFGTSVRPGSFDFAVTPTVTFPVAVQGYRAAFTALFDEDVPAPSAVRFTGPAGSGLSNTPADDEESELDDTGREAVYLTPPRSGNPPGGTYTVLYKGTARTFTAPPLDLASRVVVIFPTVELDVDNNLTGISWIYKNVNGSVISTPSFIRDVQVEADVEGDSFRTISPRLSPAVTSYAFPSPRDYGQVREITFRYTDLAGNQYFVEYSKALRFMVETRLENVYTSQNPGGSRERLLNVFVNVPADSVEAGRCFPTPNPPFPVTVETPADPIYLTPQCLERTGRTTFGDDPALIDLFNERRTLSGSPLPVGLQFFFNVTAASGATQTAVVSLDTVDLDPAGPDRIDIPNPSTPTHMPTGFTLADARLGQDQLISWTLPTFEVQKIFVSPIVNTSAMGGGLFCSGQQQDDLPPDATSTSFRFPTHCQGQPVLGAQVCVFIQGTTPAPDFFSAVSTACWFFQIGANESVGLQNGTATFSEFSSRTPRESTDGNFTDPFTGWSIANGGTTSAQTAVWETAFDVNPGVVTFQMHFAYTVPDHAIGRFRFSTTSADRATFADGLDRGGDVSAPWTVLMNPVVTSSDPNMTFTTLTDGSVLAANPSGQSTVVYTVTATNNLSRTTGLRLEVLEHPSLPTSGPGLGPAGNFILTELTMDNQPFGGAGGLQAPASASSYRPPRRWR